MLLSKFVYYNIPLEDVRAASVGWCVGAGLWHTGTSWLLSQYHFSALDLAESSGASQQSRLGPCTSCHSRGFLKTSVCDLQSLCTVECLGYKVYSRTVLWCFTVGSANCYSGLVWSGFWDWMPWFWPCVKHKLGCLIQVSSLVYRQDFCLGDSAGVRWICGQAYTKDLESLLEMLDMSLLQSETMFLSSLLPVMINKFWHCEGFITAGVLIL